MSIHEEIEHKPDVRSAGIKSLKAKANLKRTFTTRMADELTAYFGSTLSLLLHLVIFLVWVTLNSGTIPGFEPFDPFPFVFLTSLVSLEAIVLSIFVLISQNRETEVADLREEVDLQITIRAEAEITKILQMLDEIQQKLGIEKKADRELKSMEHKINTEKIVRDLEQEIETRTKF